MLYRIIECEYGRRLESFDRVKTTASTERGWLGVFLRTCNPRGGSYHAIRNLDGCEIWADRPDANDRTLVAEFLRAK